MTSKQVTFSHECRAEDYDDILAVALAYPEFAQLYRRCAAATRSQIADLADTLCAHPELLPHDVTVEDVALIARFLRGSLPLTTAPHRPIAGVPIPKTCNGEPDDTAQ